LTSGAGTAIIPAVFSPVWLGRPVLTFAACESTLRILVWYRKAKVSIEDALQDMTTITGQRRTTADEVFDRIHEEILSLTLLPGTRISEAEIANRLGVSRQPVREAFLRLAKLNFLLVRPQRSTEIRKISEAEVLNAKFIRETMEVAAAELACDRDLTEWLPRLQENLDMQKAAVAKLDLPMFHALDDAFHKMICEASGKAFVWELISENKAHMDRARLLNLKFEEGLNHAHGDHLEIFAALKAGDGVLVKETLRKHLSRIGGALKHIRARNAAFFED
jgi:GntR family transcriptional regulator, rspAB operon transcriptional repressor